MTGAMDHVALEKLIQEEIAKGNKPFFLNSVAGSTVMGSFDDHHALSAICKKYGMWHHVDACWGGFLVLSEQWKEKLFNGIEKIDSVAFNPHKGLGVPGQCSLLITNNKKDALRKSNTSGASYLFHETEYSKYDIGDKTLSCGRRADSFKLWLSMKKHGMDGFVRIADYAMEKSIYITKRIREQPDKFEMVNDPMGVNICFWYFPPAFRGDKKSEYTDELKTQTHKLIFERFQQHGTVLIQHNPLPEYNLPNFLRLVLKGEKSSIEDMDYLLSEIDRIGNDITAETFVK